MKSRLTPATERLSKFSLAVLTAAVLVALMMQPLGGMRNYTASVLLMAGLIVTVLKLARPLISGVWTTTRSRRAKSTGEMAESTGATGRQKSATLFRDALWSDSTSDNADSLQSGGTAYVLALAVNLIWFVFSTITSQVNDQLVEGMPWWNAIFVPVLDLNVASQFAALLAAMTLVVGSKGVKRLDLHFVAWVVSFVFAVSANLQALIDTHYHHPPDAYFGWKCINGATLFAYALGAWLIISGRSMKPVVIAMVIGAMATFVLLLVLDVQV